MCESYVRGVWLHQCASAEDIEKIIKKDKNQFPKFSELVDDVEKLESQKEKFISKIVGKSWNAMNGYTHTGIHQITKRLTGTSIEPNYDDDEIRGVVDFANALGCLAAMAICDLTNNKDVASAILDKLESDFV